MYWNKVSGEISYLLKTVSDSGENYNKLNTYCFAPAIINKIWSFDIKEQKALEKQKFWGNF